MAAVINRSGAPMPRERNRVASQIERYERVPVEVREYDPEAPAVARRVIELIAASGAGTAEHVGSSAVPGLAGKGTVDLLLPTPTDDIPEVTEVLVDAGFQRQQIAKAFPPTRPMLQGAIRHRGKHYRLHVHVVPAGSPEVEAMRGFCDALRADATLRDDYVALKRAIIARGLTDSVDFSVAKHPYITAVLERLGFQSSDQPGLDPS
jgi:GrpB-like predicted nucleotidyltransferase (UPF0157 family)